MPETQGTRRRLAAILFADVVGYTAIMQRDESEATRVRHSFRSLMHDAVERHAGDIVQFYGDGALVVLDSAKEAVGAAVDIQSAAVHESTVPLRVGIHVGDIVQDDSGVYGDGVNVASRIESMAVPGAVLLSERVHTELVNHPGIVTVRLGEFNLKNVAAPVGVYAVQDDRIKVPAPGQIEADSKASARKCIAVMPFAARGGEESTYFADGLAQEIVNALTHVDGMSVISRSTSRQVRPEEEGPIAIGRRLGVCSLLEGTVRKAGDQIRVSVQLVNTADGSQLWAQTYDRRFENVFDVQDDIAQLVVNGLKLNFDAERRKQPLVERGTRDADAYNLYLKGVHHWNNRNPESSRKAVGLLEEALVLDPGFAAADSMLSRCYAYLGSCGVLPAKDAYFRGLEHATRAIERDPGAPEAHLALAALKFYHLWDWQGTKESLDRAEALGLDSAEYHELRGTHLAAIGQPAAALPQLQRAVELNPLSVPTMYVLAATHFFCADYDSALALYDEIIDLNPAFRGAYQLKGFALTMLGQLEEALDILERYHDMVGHPLKGLTCLALVHERLGHEDEVEDCVARMYRRLEEDDTPSAEIDLALVTAALGRHDRAIQHLNRVYEQRYSLACTGMLWILRCPIYEELWQEPEYRALLARMGLER